MHPESTLQTTLHLFNDGKITLGEACEKLRVLGLHIEADFLRITNED